MAKASDHKNKTTEATEEEKASNPAPANQPKANGDDGAGCDDPANEQDQDEKPQCPTGYPDRPDVDEDPNVSDKG